MSDYKFLIIPFLVTLVSQFIKCLLDKERRGGIITFLDLSGGMPSSHSGFKQWNNSILNIKNWLYVAVERYGSNCFTLKF